MKLSINDTEVEVEEDTTILEAARRIDIYIPTICHHPDLPKPNEVDSLDVIYRGNEKIIGESSKKEFGGCGLCLVQVEGREELIKACSTLVSEGMKVYTESDSIQNDRRVELMRILSKHPHACLICAQKEGCTTEPCSTNVPLEERCCPNFGNCELQRVAGYIGIREDTPRYTPSSLPLIEDEPLFLRDYNLCIGCTRCVRACQELRGVRALGFVFKNDEVFVGTIAQTLTDSDCRFCGACVEVCPTGALRDKKFKTAKREVDLVPCRFACPAEVDVPRYIQLVSEGRFTEAAAVVREKLPLPNVLAHTCSRPCESVCRRREINDAISICGLKRFAMENDAGTWKQDRAIAQSTGKKAAIIGSGPAGLSAAYYLARMGHSVTIFETMPEPGGMMRYGIEECRLPKKIVEQDIQEIAGLGVEIKTGLVLGKDLTFNDLRQEGFEAILVAAGLQAGRELKVEGAKLPGVVGGLDFMRNVRLGNTESLKGRVLIIGGGNVAMDVALTALRLGAGDVQVACLEKADEMPAFRWEIEQALEEGVEFHHSYGVKRILANDSRTLEVELMRCLSVFDEEGRFTPTFDEEQTVTMETDMLVLAIGQAPDLSWQKIEKLNTTESGLVQVDNATMQTSIPDIFGCGDIAEDATSVVEALSSGRHAAIAIDKYLGGTGTVKDDLVAVEEPDPWIGKVQDFAYRQRVPMPCLPVEKRKGNFLEVELGYDEEMALEEAGRCLRCDLRLGIQNAPTPPEMWLILEKETLESIPETEGVYQLLNEKRETIYIKGTINLKEELKQQLAANKEAKYFVYEEAKMYTMRESELLQHYMKRYGKMPNQNLEIEDDLY